MLMLRMREFADRKSKNWKCTKKMCGPGVSDIEESWHFKWLRFLRRWAHLLHRPTSETGVSVLNYDYEYILLHYAISFYIPLTFVFGLTGKLHPAKKNRRLLLMNCKSWWRSWRNTLQRKCTRNYFLEIMLIDWFFRRTLNSRRIGHIALRPSASFFIQRYFSNTLIWKMRCTRGGWPSSSTPWTSRSCVCRRASVKALTLRRSRRGVLQPSLTLLTTWMPMVLSRAESQKVLCLGGRVLGLLATPRPRPPLPAPVPPPPPARGLAPGPAALAAKGRGGGGGGGGAGAGGVRARASARTTMEEAYQDLVHTK